MEPSLFSTHSGTPQRSSSSYPTGTRQKSRVKLFNESVKQDNETRLKIETNENEADEHKTELDYITEDIIKFINIFLIANYIVIMCLNTLYG